MHSKLPILTFDIDWAPDFVINWVLDKMVEFQVRSTWFVTHNSPAIERLRAYPNLFELGIHPNCFKNSSHGNTEEEVLDYICGIVPEAISMRTHGLYQSSNFLLKACKNYGIKIDCSIYLPRSVNIETHIVRWSHMNLLRVPHFWADGTEKFEKKPIWSVKHPEWNVPGLKVLDFHPIHIYLNSINPEIYQDLLEKRSYDQWTPEFLEPYISKEQGPQSFFLELINNMENAGICIKDLHPDIKL